MKHLFSKVLIASAAALTLASCSTDEISGDIDGKTGSRQVTFGAYMGKTAQTRGAITDKSTLKQGFGITAFDTKQDTWTSYAGSEANFMYNQKVTGNGNAFEYSPIKYWPTQSGEKISFFAYAPYATSTNGITVAKNDATVSAKSGNTIDFTVNTTPSKQIDFVAAAVTDKSYSTAENVDNEVKFQFKHELTRLNIKAKTSSDLADNSYVVIKSLTLLKDGYNGSGTYTYPTATTTSATTSPRGTWSGVKAISSYIDAMDIVNKETVKIGSVYQKSDAIKVSSATAQSLFKNGEYLFFVPTEDLKADVAQVEVKYEIVTADSKLSKGYTCLPAEQTVSLKAGSLKQGKAYCLTLNFDLHKVMIDTETSVENWDEEKEIDSEKIITIDDNKKGTQEIRTTSNCFMVNPASYTAGASVISIPLSNMKIFWNSPYATNKISDWSDKTLEAEVIWQDIDAQVIKFVNLEGTKGTTADTQTTIDTGNEGTINFLLTDAAAKNLGNILIGVKEKNSDTYLWSYHIWLSDYDKSKDLKYEDGNGKGYRYCSKIKDLGFGERDPLTGQKPRLFDSTFVDVPAAPKVWEQGQGAIMDINLGATSNDVKPTNVYGNVGLFYQYGRKDPFTNNGLELNKKGSAPVITDAVVYDITGKTKANVFKIVEAPVAYEEAVKNPTTFYKSVASKNVYDWVSNNTYYTNSWNEAAGYEGLFSPCPEGYTIPEHGTWDVFAEENTPRLYGAKPRYSSPLTKEANYGYSFYYTYNDTKTTFYPFGSSIAGSAGNNRPETKLGYYWTSTVYSTETTADDGTKKVNYSTSSCRCLYIGCNGTYDMTEWVHTQANYSRTMGAHIRCVQK